MLNPIRYRGYVYDEETGNYFLNARYYDPEIGRFISADSTEVPSITPGNTKWDKNLYAYCDNNPVSRIDDQGRCWILGAVIGGVLGGSFAVLNDLVLNGEVSIDHLLIGVLTGAVSGFIGVAELDIGSKLLFSSISSIINAYLTGASLEEALISVAAASLTTVVSSPVCSLTRGIDVSAGMNKLSDALVGGVVTSFFETNSTLTKGIIKQKQNSSNTNNHSAKYYSPKSSISKKITGGGMNTNTLMNY